MGTKRKNERVGITEFQGIENAYLIISGIWQDDKRDYCKSTVSFFYDGGEFGAEWEPQYGPIQVWEKCDESHPKARKHYFYDYVVDIPMNWSQLAVNENRLPQMFVEGNYEWIYDILRNWTTDIEHEPIEETVDNYECDLL